SSIYNCTTGSCAGTLTFYLNVFDSPANIAGDYFLTFTADNACADLPAALRTRTYAATIAPAPADARFHLTANGPLFQKYDNSWTYNGFEIGVAGHYLSMFLFGGHNPAIVERLAPNTYLAFSGNATTSVGTSTPSPMATAFDGWIEYCVLKSEMNG